MPNVSGASCIKLYKKGDIFESDVVVVMVHCSQTNFTFPASKCYQKEDKLIEEN